MTAILCKNEKFAIIDEAAYINEIYKSSGFQVDAKLFDINGPYMMDSQFEAMKNPDRRIRKRKRPTSEYLVEECNNIIALLPEIQEAGTSNGVFKKCQLKDNNKRAREASKSLNSSGSISSNKIPLNSENGMWINDSNEFKVISHDDDKFLIPPRAKFHIGNVNFTSKEKIADSFDLIIMDPPWLNRSAKRTAKYELSDDVIHTIDIGSLRNNGLMCLWVTNRRGIQEECIQIFKKWNLEMLATWYWLKVTKEGEPVCDFNSSHKVPFEIILVGCPIGKGEMWENRLPKRFIFASVPMAVHSRKPPMQLLLSVFDLTFSRSLEFFARNLWPHTFSPNKRL